MSSFKPLIVLAVVLIADVYGDDKIREKKGLLGLGYGGAFGSYGANVNYDALAALYGPHNVGYGSFGAYGLGYTASGGQGAVGGLGGFGHGAAGGLGGFGQGAGGFGHGGFGSGGLGLRGVGGGLGGFGGYHHPW